MTTAQYVTVVLDRYDGSGRPIVGGAAWWTPSQELPDPADMMLVGEAPVPARFLGSAPVVKLIANDSIGPQQEDGTPGWTWNLSYSGVPGNPPAASYYILSTNGTTQYLSSLASTPAAQPGALFVPLPNTPPSSTSQVLGVSQDSPLVTEWVNQSGGGAVASVFGRTGAVAAQSGDYTAAQVGADASGAAATAQTNAETYAAGVASSAQSNAETYAAGLQPTSGSPLARSVGGTGLSETTAASLLTALGGLLAANNLSDLPSPAAALANLGLPTPTAANQIPVSNSSNQWVDAQAGTVGGNTYNAGWTVGTSDLGGEALYTGSSAGTATIPSGLTSTVGATFAARQDGTGALTIAAGSGVTVYGAPVTTGRYQTLFARQVAANTWAVTASYGSSSPLALPSAASLMPAWMPSGAISENLPRLMATGGDSNQTTGIPFISPGPTLIAGQSHGHVNLYVSSTAGSGQTHAWVALLNLANQVLGVSADAGSTLWDGGSTFLSVAVALAAALVPAVDTPTKLVICQTASALTTFRGMNGTSSIVGGIAPYLAGGNGSAQSAPPSVGATLPAVSSGSSVTPYAWLTA